MYVCRRNGGINETIDLLVKYEFADGRFFYLPDVCIDVSDADGHDDRGRMNARYIVGRRTREIPERGTPRRGAGQIDVVQYGHGSNSRLSNSAQVIGERTNSSPRNVRAAVAVAGLLGAATAASIYRSASRTPPGFAGGLRIPTTVAGHPAKVACCSAFVAASRRVNVHPPARRPTPFYPTIGGLPLAPARCCSCHYPATRRHLLSHALTATLRVLSVIALLDGRKKASVQSTPSHPITWRTWTPLAFSPMAI